METQFKKSATLNQVISELEQSGCIEITRILPYGNRVFIFEYNAK